MGAEGHSSNVYGVSVGARTPLGMNAPSSAAAVRAGIAGFSEHPSMVDMVCERMIVAKSSYLSDDLSYIDRLVELAFPAAQEALLSLLERANFAQPVPIIIGLPASRPGLAENLGEQFVERFRIHLQKYYPISSVEILENGHAAGLMALESGWQKIKSGAVDVCIVGGVDSYLDPNTLEWLDNCDQLHSSSNSYGFIPGEAAGFCLLASQQAAGNIGLISMGIVSEVAKAIEHN